MSKKQFTYVRKDGTTSKPVAATLIKLAASRVVKGPGTFKVVRSSQYEHPNLTSREAYTLLGDLLDSIPVDGDVAVWKAGVGDKPVFRTVRVVVNTYKNPFRNAFVSAARIDAGEDLCGSGHVTAIGPAVIVQRGVPSHTSSFGNLLSSYRLTDGPAKGLVVFFAEHYDLALQASVGQAVDADTVLYDMNGCIEIGWATPDGTGSWAWSLMGYTEGQRSALGQNMSDLLGSLGAPPGLTLGRPITGHLPPNWPTWPGHT